MESVFKKLNAVDVSAKIEKKNGLSYLSWAWAWAELKKEVPTANYTIYENKDGLNYHHDGKTAWVKVGVTANELEHIEHLPVMNHSNRSIPVEQLTSFDVNKAIQRAVVKAIARHGLGLCIYAGEDLPEGEAKEHKPEHKAPVEAPRPQIEGMGGARIAEGISNMTTPKAAPKAPAAKKALFGKVDKKLQRQGSPFASYTLEGNDTELSTKDPAIMEAMKLAKESGEPVIVAFNEVVNGRFTNRYITEVKTKEDADMADGKEDLPF